MQSSRRQPSTASSRKSKDEALQAAKGTLTQAQNRNRQMAEFIAEVESLPETITEFRSDYWGHLVEKVTVHRKKELVFTFSCGVEIRV